MSPQQCFPVLPGWPQAESWACRTTRAYWWVLGLLILVLALLVLSLVVLGLQILGLLLLPGPSDIEPTSTGPINPGLTCPGPTSPGPISSGPTEPTSPEKQLGLCLCDRAKKKCKVRHCRLIFIRYVNLLITSSFQHRGPSDTSSNSKLLTISLSLGFYPWPLPFAHSPDQ